MGGGHIYMESTVGGGSMKQEAILWWSIFDDANLRQTDEFRHYIVARWFKYFMIQIVE